MSEENPMRPTIFTDEVREEEKASEIDVDFENKAVAFLKEAEPSIPVAVERAAPMPLKPPNKNETGPWIRYNGVAVVRNITAAEWKQVGVMDQGDTQWNYLNSCKVPVSELSPSAIRYCLEVDGRFTKVEK